MIIGITGKKGSGKSSAAAWLVDQDYRVMSFAEPLKAMVRLLMKRVGISTVDIEHYEQNKETYIVEIGCSYRVLCQSLGTQWGREVNKSLWLICARHALKFNHGSHVVFDDVRFDNEADFIRDQGGLIIHLMRPSSVVDDHESERGVKFVEGDALVINEGSLDQLLGRIGVVVDALGVGG